MPQTSAKDEPTKKADKKSSEGVKEENKEAPKTTSKSQKPKQKNPFSFRDPLQAKLVTCIMKQGKKTIAQKILKDAFDEMHRQGEKDALKTFEDAIKNVTPTMEVRPKRIGGAVYQIPVEVDTKRQQTLALRWILSSARSQRGKPMHKRLANELIDAANERGNAFSKKEETHRIAQSNKAFAHLAKYR